MMLNIVELIRFILALLIVTTGCVSYPAEVYGRLQRNVAPYSMYPSFDSRYYAVLKNAVQEPPVQYYPQGQWSDGFVGPDLPASQEEEFPDEYQYDSEFEPAYQDDWYGQERQYAQQPDPQETELFRDLLLTYINSPDMGVPANKRTLEVKQSTPKAQGTEHGDQVASSTTASAKKVLTQSTTVKPEIKAASAKGQKEYAMLRPASDNRRPVWTSGVQEQIRGADKKLNSPVRPAAGKVLDDNLKAELDGLREQ